MIETLRVQNYKSLKDIEIPLKPLTVLVGPNGAGKSNILDCLAFLSETAASGDTGGAVAKRGGYRDVVWGGKTGETMSLEVFWPTLGPKAQPTLYRLQCNGQPGGERGVVSWAQGEVVRTGDKEILAANPLVRETMANWCFYDLLPRAMRQLQGVAKQTRLRPDGSNVATLLHWIYSEEREIFDAVEEHLKDAIPEVSKMFSRLTEDGETYVAWLEEHVPGQIPAWNMSEGSVRLVGMLLALLVPQPPLLVAFENPDLHLHARMMEYLSEILKAASRRSQVIITTHSPYLLDHMPPESVLVVWKENGETKVKPVKDSDELREALKTLGLGEMYYAGHFGGVP